MRCLDLGERRDLLLQLEDYALRRLLPDPGNGLEERVVLADDRTAKFSGGVAGDDRERNLGAHTGDRQKLLEELALVGVSEAEELHGVLAYVQVRLDDDLVRTVCLAHRGGSGEQPIADAVHVEDEPVCVPGDRFASQARDHRALPASATSGGARAWQMATASASAAWCGFGGSASPRIALTMLCTCAFSARPYPHTACFTLAGGYSAQKTPADAHATSAAPRACPTESAVRASAPTNDSSRTTASGS